MTPELLSRLGLALYGPEWQTPLAAALGVSDRTVRNWTTGRTAPSWQQVAALRALIDRRCDEWLSEVADRLRDIAAIQQELEQLARS